MTDAITVRTSLLRCPRCRDETLTSGAPLDGSSCGVCGGVLLPSTGGERLLQEELQLSRAQLLEIADVFGGRRCSCPYCSARMRPLVLRGIDLELCFTCGATWLDRGELERLSGNRYRVATPQRQAPTTAMTQAAQQSVHPPVHQPVHQPAHHLVHHLRLDARAAPRRLVGWVLRGLGLGTIVAGFTGLAGFHPVWAVAALAGGQWLLRRDVVDVQPRAGRISRSRRFLPPPTDDDAAEPFADNSAVVIRPIGGLRHLASAELVDDSGRSLSTLGVGPRSFMRRRAHDVGKKLGVRVLSDPRVDPQALLPGSTHDLPLLQASRLTFRLLPTPRTEHAFELLNEAGAVVGRLQNAVPARGDEEGDAQLALCFFLEDAASGQRLRLHHAVQLGRSHTVVVGPDGEAWGALRRSSGALWSRYVLNAAGQARRVHLWLLAVNGWFPVFDDALARLGSVSLQGGGVAVHFTQDAPASRWMLLALAAHAAIDETPTLRSMLHGVHDARP